MRLAVAGAQQVDDLVSADVKQLGDQPSVATPPERLGAEEARDRPGDGGRERLLPFRGSHPRGVAAERRDADAAEQLLPGLAAPPAAELDCVHVADPGCTDRRGEGRAVELRMTARP